MKNKIILALQWVQRVLKNRIEKREFEQHREFNKNAQPQDYDLQNLWRCEQMGIDPKLKTCPKCGLKSSMTYVSFYKGFELHRLGMCGHVDFDFPVMSRTITAPLTAAEWEMLKESVYNQFGTMP